MNEVEFIVAFKNGLIYVEYCGYHIGSFFCLDNGHDTHVVFFGPFGIEVTKLSIKDLYHNICTDPHEFKIIPIEYFGESYHE